MNRILAYYPEDTFASYLINDKKAIMNRDLTIQMIDEAGGLFGNVLDIGSRNYFTQVLEHRYGLKIYNTTGDLDEVFQPEELFKFDWVHYNNVIEHQFNPLFTLLEIRKVMKDDGRLILGTPVKPNWMTFAGCHFHEFDEGQLHALLHRAGFKIISEKRFWRDIRVWGIRQLFGSFYNKQSLFICEKS